MRFGRLLIAVMMIVSMACSHITEKPQQNYQLVEQLRSKLPNVWKFEGRLAMNHDKESVSASIIWEHKPESDVIDLSGPMAQGRIKISVTDTMLQIDDGEQVQSYEGNPEQILLDQLGLNMPVKSLKYWVQGVNDPSVAFDPAEDGFVQSGWSIHYKSMQKLSQVNLPYKMSVENERTRLKLIVDQWNIL